MNRSIRLVLCFAVCAAMLDSVLATNLPSGPVQVDPSIPYPEKMTFVGLSQSVLLGASIGTSEWSKSTFATRRVSGEI
jgi:hypothetical protein